MVQSLASTLALTGALILSAAGARAECPAPPDHSVAETGLLDRLATSRTEMEGRQISGELWQLYFDAPDREAQTLLDDGLGRLRIADYAGAIEILSALVARCPDYAEGWNQRAFASFLSNDFASAVSDLEEALRLSPRHVPAMSGLALSLMGLGRTEAAQSVLRDALALNPWLPERRYLVGPPSKDI